MRTAGAVRNDIFGIAEAINSNENRGGVLRKQLGRLLVEARDHPELTLEEGRRAPREEIPRQTANRLIREATEANETPMEVDHDD